MKNSGPAFIGATMRKSIFFANGASPFLARPNPVRRHEAEVDIIGVEPASILDAGMGGNAHLDWRKRGIAFEHRLERVTLAQERAVALRGADAQPGQASEPHPIRP